MEADVALHTPEKWASSGEQHSDKIKYVYSNRRKEREAKSARKASRLQQIKPSRSYDNDMEALSKKEPGVTQLPPAPKTKDDSSMRYGERVAPSRQQGRARELGYSGIPTPKSSPCTSRKNPALVHAGGSDTRWKPRDRKLTPRERRKNPGCESPRTFEKQPSLPEAAGTVSQMQQKKIKTAKSLEDKVPLRSDIPSPPQSIVLEVRDGPSICYKPSQTMLSDASELDSYGEVKKSPCENPDFERPTASCSCDQPERETVFDDGHARAEHSRVCPDDRPLPTLLKAQEAFDVDSEVFRNVSEASQRRHGVRHDDIVVGPAAHRQFDLSEGPSDLSSFDNSSISDEAAFSSVSLMSQQKAGVRHDDIVVGPNAKKQRAAVHQSKDVQPKTPPGLPPVPGSRATKGDHAPPSSCDTSTQQTDQFQENRSEPGSKLISPKSTTGSTLERESRIPKLHDKVTEQKQRGASPGSGIPVFRQGRTAEKAQDNLRGVSPVVSEKTKSQSRTPVCLEEGSKTDRSYGSVDRARWRPKPNKSGLHRMKRGAKREANVSTESGYATDQMPSSDTNDSKVSPQHSSDIRDRFHRLSGSCNDIDKDLEELVLDSRPAGPGKKQTASSGVSSENVVVPKSTSKSKSKSSQKQRPEKGAKLNAALSNIPVVLGHDDPSSNDYPQPPPIPHNHYDQLHHSQDSQPISKQPMPFSFPSDTYNTSERESTLSAQMTSDCQDLYTPPPSPLSSAASASSTTVPSVPPPVNSTTANVPSTSSAPTAVVKPRLHRSAEHLVGPTKLSVFHSSDDVKHQPDTASDVSCSTTSSSKTSKSHPDSSRDRHNKSQSKKLEALATPKRSAAPVKGRSVSMLRKETERSVAIVRRGSDRAIPVSRHDPSVHDLKAATSLKELCQSMASLLHIDNEKAAEMLSTSLSKRRDLVEGLDADAILDYLTHHGVLDPSVLVNLESKNDGEPPSTIQRNSAILKHVEEHGDTAVALFINALRQSGQLHLASSLDTEQRIKPMSGEGYLDKPRHKGEIVVRLSVEALKILAPREPPSERNVNLHLLTSPYGDYNSDMLDSDEDQVKPKSCWCFCVSRKRRTRSSSSKKEKRKNKSEDQPFGGGEGAIYPNAPHLREGIVNPGETGTQGESSVFPGQNFSQTNNFNGSKTSTSLSPPYSHSTPVPAGANPSKEKKKKNKAKTKNSGTPYVPGAAEDPYNLSSVPDHAIIHPRQEEKSTSKGKKSSKQHKNEAKQIPKDLKLSSASDKSKRTKDTTEGIFMEYDSHLELVKLRACHDELSSPTRQSGPVGIMVEQWKSSGKHYLIKSDMLCRSIVDEFLTDIIKYFEQDRGTLVLDVVSEATSVTVFNICMTKSQIAKLEKDHIDGSLSEKLQEIFMSRLDISKFDIRGVRFCTEVDRNQLKSVLSELS